MTLLLRLPHQPGPPPAGPAALGLLPQLPAAVAAAAAPPRPWAARRHLPRGPPPTPGAQGPAGQRGSPPWAARAPCCSCPAAARPAACAGQRLGGAWEAARPRGLCRCAHQRPCWPGGADAAAAGCHRPTRRQLKPQTSAAAAAALARAGRLLCPRPGRPPLAPLLGLAPASVRFGGWRRLTAGWMSCAGRALWLGRLLPCRCRAALPPAL